MNSLETWAAPRRERVERALSRRFGDAWPDSFVAMCRYPLQTGGKRMRPLLAFAAYEAVASNPENLDLVIPGAMAIELIHTYSLVHDDLPAMDDDEIRRGQPTVHVRYGEGAAILVGDALLTEAFSVLSENEMLSPAQALASCRELSEAAGYRGMIGGQATDLELGGPVTDVDTLEKLHRGKTGALMRAAVRMGAIAGDATPTQLDALTRYAEALGLAFQLADDILDADQDAGEDGPPSFVKLLGIEETRNRARGSSLEAEEALEGLSDPTILSALARFTIERQV